MGREIKDKYEDCHVANDAPRKNRFRERKRRKAKVPPPTLKYKLRRINLTALPMGEESAGMVY